MKISKPPSGSVSGRPVGLPAAKGAGATGFADKLAGATKARATTATQSAGRAREVRAVVDIGKALQAGQITPQAALDRVVERIVARRVGRNGPAAVKETLGTALRQALEDDPMLAARVRTLGDE
jgi:hypothetical protein